MNSSRDSDTNIDKLNFKPSHFPYFLAISSIESLIGVILNATVIVAILRHSSYRALPGNLLVLNLSTIDLVSAAFVLPFHVVVVWEGKWITSNFDIHRLVLMLAVLTGICAIIAITIDRYIGVAYSLRYQAIVTHGKVKLGIAVTWVLPTSMSLVFFATTKSVVWEIVRLFNQTLLLIATTMVFVLYSNMLYYSWKQSKKISSQLVSVVGGRKKVKRALGLMKSARKIFLILCLYVGTFAPLVIYKVIQGKETEMEEVRYWLILIPFGTSCLNPLVYSIGNRRFQRIMKAQRW